VILNQDTTAALGSQLGSGSRASSSRACLKYAQPRLSR
jgi:hypothetical protein